MDITFTKKQVTRKILIFADAACRTIEARQSQDSKGAYRFIDKLKNDIYIVEYSLDVGNGITAHLNENILLKDGTLYLAANASGEGMGVLDNEPLKRIGGTSPTEPTPPSENESDDGAVATDYSQARYAVCNQQGRVIIIDLQGVDLANESRGTSRIGTRSCTEGEAVTWYEGNHVFSISRQGEYPQITFDELDNTYINTSSSGDGLEHDGYPSGAYSVIVGNSGKCLFTKTKGVQNVYGICN